MYIYMHIYIYISAGTKTRGHKGGHEHKLSSQVVRFFRMVCVWFQRLFPDEKSFFYRPAQLPLLALVPVLGLAPAMAPRSARGPSRSMDPKNHGAFPWSNFHMIMKPTWWLTYPPWKIWKSDWIIIPTIGEVIKAMFQSPPTSYPSLWGNPNNQWVPMKMDVSE